MKKSNKTVRNTWAWFQRSTMLFLAVVSLAALVPPPDFLTEQKKHLRVKEAFEEKGQSVLKQLQKANIKPDQVHILLKACKAERQLELYAKSKNETAYQKILTYPICASSGQLGPKRKQGDYQVPEGFYHIDRFNPESLFYLSLGINYPNQSDRRKSNAKDPGGDIFIHGACMTMGCLPMTDDKIKEIYLYAILARQSGQQHIPVYIFPFKMTDANMKIYKLKYEQEKELLAFWENLKTGYDKFAVIKRELNVTVDKNGNYVF